MDHQLLCNFFITILTLNYATYNYIRYLKTYTYLARSTEFLNRTTVISTEVLFKQSHTEKKKKHNIKTNKQNS